MDAVNHPKHYTSHPSGIECIQVTEHMNFCIGNAIKYLWRADDKNHPIEDLHKAVWYVKREIQRREREACQKADEELCRPNTTCVYYQAEEVHEGQRRGTKDTPDTPSTVSAGPCAV